MIDQENKLKKKVQFIVACSMGLFFVLVTVMVFLLAVRINLRNQERNLLAQSAQLEQLIKKAQYDTEHFKNPQFVEEYAIKYLDKGQQGDKIFD